MKYFPVVWLLFIFLIGCKTEPKPIKLKSGLTISSSVTIKEDIYELNGTDSLDQPVLTIEGNDLVVDFNNAILKGSNDQQWPNEFYGLGILVKGENITIRNLTVAGYKVALMAVDVDSLKIENADLSYNYRQQLKSSWAQESLDDWLSYHHNEKDEWLRYGAAAYLKNCDHALVKNLKVTGGQNGLMLTQCDDGLFINNTIQFNSGVGIGLYRSSRNQVLHNKLDWNVRGYSHGKYSRGQDSAGILCYEESRDNTFAFNSATHSGDGFFLWADQMETEDGANGCNGNLIYRNDFSYAPANGVEVTFSSNYVIGNRLEECNYGIWAGYSWETIMFGNSIKNNHYGIAVEHGQDNQIINNGFEDNQIGVQLWERENQPEDWGYVKAKDVSSRNYQILNNTFSKTKVPLSIRNTDSVLIQGNTFFDYETLHDEKKTNTNLVLDTSGQATSVDLSLALPRPLVDGQQTHASRNPPARPFLHFGESVGAI